MDDYNEKNTENNNKLLKVIYEYHKRFPNHKKKH